MYIKIYKKQTKNVIIILNVLKKEKEYKTFYVCENGQNIRIT